MRRIGMTRKGKGKEIKRNEWQKEEVTRKERSI